MADFMKKPCEKCPYRTDVKPYLHPKRGEELAYHTHNPYNSFTCHQTLEDSEDGEDLCAGSKSKECAGFLTLMANENGEDSVPEGFKPSYELVYEDAWAMTDAYNPED